MSKSTAGDSRPPLLSSGSGSSNASATQTTIRLVSTSTNPSSRGSSPPPLDGDYREHLGGSPTSSYSSVDSSTAEDWRRWMRAYTAGSWRGDVAPHPPPPISAVLKAAGELRDPLSSSPRLPVHSLPPPAPSSSNEPSPADFTIYPESASSRSSNGSFVDNPDVNDVMDHFQKKRFLKGPKSPYEQERLRSMKRYNLDDPNRRASIDRVCRLAKCHFSTQTIIVTLVFEGHSVVAAEAGYDPRGVDPSPEEPVRPLPDLDISLCAHGMLKVTEPGKPREAFVVPDLSKDWRFKNNPQAVEQGGGLAFYASSNINMPTDVDDATVFDVPPTLPVGSICVISDKPRESEADFTQADRQFLHDCSDMIAREFALGYEQKRREAEQSQSAFLGRFLETTLVQPLDRAVPKKVPSSPAAPSTSAIRDGQATQDEQHKAEAEDSVISAAFEIAAQQLLQLTGSTSAAILDLRAFRAPLPSAYAVKRMGKEWSAAGMRAEGAADVLATRRPSINVSETIPEEDETGNGDQESEYSRRQNANTNRRKPSMSRSSSSRIYLMSSEGDIDWDEIAADQEGLLGQAVTDTLLSYYEHGRTEYGPRGHVHPLAAVLPDPDMPCCIVPVFDAGVPSLLLVLTSSDKYYTFEASDRTFVQNVGSVLASALLRERAFAVDRAKLAFVSQVSHELRTPLHGVTSQLELIREFSSPQQLLKLAPMLDVADLCLESLREVLSDVLTFGKLSNTTSPDDDAQQASLVKGDLATLVEDVIKATWVRGRREALIENDASSSSSSQPKIDMVLEVQERVGGWTCWLDPGGLKRVLLNLLGNSLKFTEKGSVKLSLREGNSSPTSDKSEVIIDVVDTGCGMPGEFLREKLFTPFVQANPFASGAGLGMSICATIVKRLGGEIDVASVVGKGTTIRLTLPVEFTPDSCPPSPSPDSPQSGAPTPRQTYSPTTPRQSSAPLWSPRVSTRIISDELMALFSPGSRLAQTPFDERADFDFGRAIDAAHQAIAADQPRLKRIPSSKRRTKPTGTDLASPSDFADELAKLTVSEAATSPPARSGFDLRPLPSPGPGKQRAPATPDVPKTLPSPVAMPPAPDPSVQTRLKARVNVLFADDNVIARNILNKLFVGKSVQATSASDGQEAVNSYKYAHAARDPFNLALLDVQMPNKDGIEASHEIRDYERSHGLPRCRIIALTGLDNEVDMQKAGVLSEDGPVDRWITKGGKSMRAIMQEVTALQEDLDAAGSGP